MRRFLWAIEDAIGYVLGYTNCRVCGRSYWRVDQFRTCITEWHEYEGGGWSIGPTACFEHRR